jgi:hypothetical protein
MADLDDQDDTLGIVDRVHYAVVALSDPISVRMARQFFTPWRSRIFGQRLDSGDEPLSAGLRPDGLEFTGSRPLDR